MKRVLAAFISAFLIALVTQTFVSLIEHNKSQDEEIRIIINTIERHNGEIREIKGTDGCIRGC